MEAGYPLLPPMLWQREGAEEIYINLRNINPLLESTEEDIRSSSFKQFYTEAETTEYTYTVDEEFALKSSLKSVKQENDGRFRCPSP